jgi:hypothetical protein
MTSGLTTLLNQLKRVLLGVLALIIVTPVLGWTYQTLVEMRDDRRYPPPGNLVDVDGHRMHIFC